MVNYRTTLGLMTFLLLGVPHALAQQGPNSGGSLGGTIVTYSSLFAQGYLSGMVPAFGQAALAVRLRAPGMNRKREVTLVIGHICGAGVLVTGSLMAYGIARATHLDFIL